MGRSEKSKKYAREYARKVREERKNNGLCPGCGKHQPKSGMKYCEQCLEKKRKYDWHKMMNMPADKYDNYLQRARERSKSRYIRLKNAGLCTSCGKEKTTGYVQCDKCREKYKKMK